MVLKNRLMYLIKHRGQVLVDIIPKLVVQSPSLQKHTPQQKVKTKKDEEYCL